MENNIPQLKESPHPTEPGWYWFYGDPFCSTWHVERYIKGEQDENPWKPELYMCRVRKVSNGVIYIFNGHFPDNKLPGLWAKALVPDLPKIKASLG